MLSKSVPYLRERALSYFEMPFFSRFATMCLKPETQPALYFGEKFEVSRLAVGLIFGTRIARFYRSQESRKENNMSLKILLLDDDAQFCELHSAELINRGYEVVIAHKISSARAEVGRSAVQGAPFDLALIDGLLPDGSGIDYVAELRTEYPDLPIIFVSFFWKDLSTFNLLTQEHHVAKVLNKPIQVHELAIVVDDVLFSPAVVKVGPSSDLDGEETAISRAEDPSVLYKSNKGMIEEVKGVQAFLVKARENFMRNLPERGRKINSALDAFLHAPDTTHLAALRMETHKIRGTAGTVGLKDISNAAGALEDVTIDMESCSDLSEAIGLFREVLQLKESALQRAIRSALRSSTEGSGNDCINVLSAGLAAGDIAILQELASTGKIEHFALDQNIQIGVNQSVGWADVAVIGTEDSSVENSLQSISEYLEKSDSSELPIVLITKRSTSDQGLEAVRAGVDTLLFRPINKDDLHEVLLRLRDQNSRSKSRVLVIDDDQHFASLLKDMLTSQGFTAIAIENPMKTLEAMDVFVPDIVIVDILMPHITGFEVCRLLRAHPRYEEIPILFVTSQASPDVRIACFESGGDDYIQKPIVEQELIARVKTRLTRSRRYRRHTTIDPLTGVQIRKMAHQRLTQMLNTAEKIGSEMSIVFLDIDHFKQVNDTHGHHVGDQVLSGFGKLALKFFRDRDVVGRWGGEEFILGLAGTSASEASVLVDKFRDTIRAKPFYAEELEFHVSFSAGIASNTNNSGNIEDLIRIADQRLYDAKKQGRNRTIC